jgi:trimethylamine--corrinoid protein Co-methyltransferase
MHPRTGLSIWGNPEIGLISAATVEIAHSYGLPVNVYGFCTDAHTSDMQSGYERAINALVPALAEADEISGVGEVWGGVVSSLAQMVADDEILDSVQRMLRGFEVDRETLAVEVVAKVMDGARNFMGQRHTAQYMRRGEVMQTRLAGRGGWADWEASGRRGLMERASERAAELLASHEVPPLTQEQQVEMEKVIHRAEQAIAR